jgi:hypothetical protein
MWYIIKNLWSMWLTEWRLTDITSDELFDIIDI